MIRLLQRSVFVSRYHRAYSTGMSGFTNVTYNTRADALLERIADRCDELSEIYPLVMKEVNYEGGVLQLDTSAGSFVLNKQAPKLQIWLSSPISGPHHYDMVDGE